MPIHYVCGFAFTEADPSKILKIALIQKLKGPECNIGTWNGVGGKIEPNESSTSAMSREFMEETGVDVPENHWRLVAVGKHEKYDATVHFFAYQGELTNHVTQTEIEPVRLFKVSMYNHLPLSMNLYWLIPLALSNTAGPVTFEIWDPA